MTSKIKTLYDVLGVMPEATGKEIQKSFRQLSKTLHPDISDATDAPEKFAEIKEAYEILSNEELRKKYDKQLKAGEGREAPESSFNDVFSAFFNNQRGSNKPIRGENIEVSMTVTAEEILRATPKTLNLKRKKTCGDCSGSGKRESKGRCKICKGEGSLKKQTRTPFGVMEFATTCEECSGSGKAEFIQCKKCEGKGNVPETEVFDFQLDPTARFGKTIVYKHKGHAGVDGGETGDLRILLKRSDYDKVEVQFDYDLKERKMVPLRKILQGNPFDIVFPDGTKQEITLSEEINKSNILQFPEKGFHDDNGNRGFYNLEIIVEYPELNRLQRHQILKALGDE